MKWTCSALSRFSASSSARAGRAVAAGAAGLLVVGLERRRARWRGPRCARWACPRPCRTRWSRRSPAPRRRGSGAGPSARALAVEPGVVGHRLLAERRRSARRPAPRRPRACPRRRSRAGRRARAAPRRSAAASRARRAGRRRRRCWAGRSRSPPAADRAGRAARSTSSATRARGGGGGGDQRLGAERPRGVGEAEVVGPEVVAPLRDAVGLVDHEQAHPHLGACARGSPGAAKRSGAT